MNLAFDLWPHDERATAMYELKPAVRDSRRRDGRRLVLVPRSRIQEVAQQLRERGADVAVEPAQVAT